LFFRVVWAFLLAVALFRRKHSDAAFGAAA